MIHNKLLLYKSFDNISFLTLSGEDSNALLVGAKLSISMEGLFGELHQDQFF